jgi:hypothetical protein
MSLRAPHVEAGRETSALPTPQAVGPQQLAQVVEACAVTGCHGAKLLDQAVDRTRFIVVNTVAGQRLRRRQMVPTCDGVVRHLAFAGRVPSGQRQQVPYGAGVERVKIDGARRG